MEKCLLVIPCFRESVRLPPFLRELCSAVAKGDLVASLLVVDDGSGDKERNALRGAVEAVGAESGVAVGFLTLERNCGKGAAIRAGWEQAIGEVECIGFVDADGAVGVKGVMAVFREALDSGGVAIASRAVEGARARRTFRRAVMSRVFRCVLAWRYGIGILDTQCGCKALPRAYFERVKGELREERFGLDLELLLKARRDGVGIVEMPVEWEEKAGSKLGWRSSLGLLMDVFWKRIG